MLGFFEAEVAQSLQIPRSLRGHDRAVQAWEHVRRKPPASYDHLFRHDVEIKGTVTAVDEGPWSISSNTAFARSYQCPKGDSGATPRKGASGKLVGAVDSRQVRLQWGDCQEPTAILAALNYLYSAQHLESSSPAPFLYESGMLLLESLDEYMHPPNPLYRTARSWLEEGSLPRIGASPDGLLMQTLPSSLPCKQPQPASPLPLAPAVLAPAAVLPPNPCETSLPAPLSKSHHRVRSVLEVKCVSPFVSGEGGSGWGVSTGRPGGTGVPVWHLPQLQLEMFCAGSACSSALIVTLFVDGARIYKVQRDDQVFYTPGYTSYVYVSSCPTNVLC